MERVLITGASGFVGFHLINAALQNNLQVFAAVRKSSNIDHLKGLNIKYTYPDFNNVDALAGEIESNGYDYIIHASGITKAKTQQEYDVVNADYTYNLALAATSSRHPVKKFIFLSSLAALGPLDTTDGLISEETMPNPVTAYGKSKLLAEQRLASLTSLPLITLRPTAVYGPREKDIFIILKKISQGIEPYIGQIDQRLSFIYVEDLAASVIKSLAARVTHCAYNLSDGKVYDRYALGNYTKQVLKKRTLKIHLPMAVVKLLAGFLERLYKNSKDTPALNIEKLNELTALNWGCNIDKATKDLAFNPAYDLEKGLRQTFEWYQQNKWL
jgi:UDP-glucose 4-epimerase